MVEDEDTLREVYSMILLTQPYRVETAKDGQEALELCALHDFDLILLDLMMPRLDGVGFMEHFKKVRPPRTKVVILSNLSSGETLHRALALGANKSALKAELSPSQLLTLVRYEVDT